MEHGKLGKAVKGLIDFDSGDEPGAGLLAIADLAQDQGVIEFNLDGIAGRYGAGQQDSHAASGKIHGAGLYLLAVRCENGEAQILLRPDAEFTATLHG